MFEMTTEKVLYADDKYVLRLGEVIGQHGQSISIASEKVWGVEQGQTI
jgi:hypothetical protein